MSKDQRPVSSRPPASPTDPADEAKRRILRTSSIIGGASVSGVLLSLVRMKLAAALVGPAGVGLIGLFQNIVGVASTFGGLGLANAAPREVAVARTNRGQAAEAAVGRTVMVASSGLAILAGLVFLMLRRAIAGRVLGDPSLASDVGWLSIGVAASVMAASQTALLTAFGRIGDAARASIFGSVLMTVAAAAIFLFAGPRAPMLFVLGTLVVGCLVASYYTAKLPSPASARLQFSLLRPLVQLGIALSASALVSLVAVLVVRRIVGEFLGSSGLGAFQASWALASVYLALILQAMSADFYPRLSETIGNKDAFNRLINYQTEIAILLGGPIILGGIGAAPFVIVIFYGGAFTDAASMFSWQLVGDVLRIVSWPLSFAILAQNKRKSYFVSETVAWTVFALLAAFLVPSMGLAGVGAAYAAMYIVYLPTTWAMLGRHVRVRWTRRVTFDFLALLAASVLLLWLRTYVPQLAFVGGLTAAAIFFGLAFTRFRALYPALRRS